MISKKPHSLKMLHQQLFRFLMMGLMLLGITASGFARQSTNEVKGQVTDAAKLPVANASVQVKSSGKSVLTDNNGNYKISAAAADVLIISTIGFKTIEVLIDGKTTVDVQLEKEIKGLDEVVVIGYGTQKRSNVSSAVTSVKGEDIQKIAANNPINALQGKVAGLSVSTPGGNPGQGADVRLRGVSTFGDHQPLYIIDGVPGNGYYLNSNDIASMEVLKDGAAASIYGSQSANGVIIITTKKGKKGAPVIEINSYYSSVKPTKTYDLLNADGYQKVHKQMYATAPPQTVVPEYVNTATGFNTNWQDLISRTGSAQNHNVTMRGGGEYLTYVLGGDLTEEVGTFIGSKFSKKSVRLGNEFKKGILTVENNLIYSQLRNEGIKFNLMDAYFQSPLLPVYDPAEKYGYALTMKGLPRFQNAMGADHFLDAYNTTQYLSDILKIKLQFTKQLSYTVNLNYVNSNEYSFTHRPDSRYNANDPAISFPYLSQARSNYKEQLIEHLLSYDYKKGKHAVSVLAGYSAQQKTNESLGVSVDGKTIVRTVENGVIKEKEVPAGFPDPNFNTIRAGVGGIFSGSGTKNKYVRLSSFSRINYAYDNKYLLQLAIRRDGSSKFGENYRFGNFPSVSVGWNINKEQFMENLTWIDVLKLRASYGELGSEGGLSNYEHQALVYASNTWAGGYVQGSGATPWQGYAAWDLRNKDLRWETSKTTNFGVDFTLFQNKLSGSINYFNKTTDGLLAEVVVPPSAGVNNPTLNVARVANKGLELELSYALLRSKDWRVNLSGSFATISNEVLELANKDQAIYGAGLKFGTEHFPNQTVVGKEIGAFFLYQANGIFQSDEEAAGYLNKDGQRLQPKAKGGDIRFLDMNGDGVIDELDKTYSGTAFPKYEFGFNVDAAYKNFDLTIFFQGVAGNKLYNGARFELEGMDAPRNFMFSTLRAWTPTNKNTDMPRAVWGDPNGNNRESTRFLEDGSYLRLKTIQVGYTLPHNLLNKAKIERLRLYVSGQNLLTFTGYTGLDPEAAAFDIFSNGTIRSMYPQNKRMIVGVQLTF
ncbi:TonB-dependent receptor [Pseudoflavitalea sp. G-6-1-2]|uniref:SusC/RagA family TonB-linked outer membrane protein n=1 Tax=Pseudoflavitalea sp. G-6-1-2 TaxID=2728841 RepID=UPI00146D0FCC|nr:TonB-dependent receptor [Pseudoflavitalea sp. G-6-1-2]NML19250.1 TonB-dependent receptor [Pseudoflavitalea sp. G-6-1-2]